LIGHNVDMDELGELQLSQWWLQGLDSPSGNGKSRSPLAPNLRRKISNIGSHPTIHISKCE
jgi:hypothetical protein